MTSMEAHGRSAEQQRGENGRSIPAILVYTFLACALAWLVALPLWLGDGLASPAALPLMLVMMCTPTIAALAVVWKVDRPRRTAHALGFVPVTPVGRLLGYLALGLFLPIALCVLALVIGSLLGLFPGDFTHFSGLQQITAAQLAQAGAPDMELPVATLIVGQFVNVFVAALFINIIPALGEEIGWRGWLLPKLMRFGPWGAILISGIIWGLWHAPVILLGYNYTGTPGWLALLAMIGFCTVMGGLFGWLRLRSGSVWAPALAHSSLNAAATLPLVFIAENGVYDPLHANITGWSGWLLPAALVVVLVLAGRFAAREK